MAGQAKLAKAPQWVGNFIGARQVTDGKGRNQWRLYLKRFKEDATEVREGFECGIGLASYGDVKLGDVLEVFAVEKVETAAV